MGTKILFTRCELYTKVWLMPISRLAKEFGLSDVCSAMICAITNPEDGPQICGRIDWGVNSQVLGAFRGGGANAED
jgi:hypothetical protein